MPLDNTMILPAQDVSGWYADTMQTPLPGMARRRNPFAGRTLGTSDPAMSMALLMLASIAFLAALHAGGFRSTITIGGK